MVHESLFELPLRARLCSAEEIEQVRVLERLRGQFGVGGWQRPGEVGDGVALTLVPPVLDLNREHVAAPARFARLGGVPEAHGPVVNLLQQCDVVVPGDLCKHLLHDFAFGPSCGECAHVLEVARRESPHVRERHPEVVREAIDGPGAPAFPLLAGENRLADVPVEQHHRLVCGQHDAHAFGPDALLDLTEQDPVVGRQLFPARRRGDRSAREPASQRFPFRHRPRVSKFRLMIACARTVLSGRETR